MDLHVAEEEEEKDRLISELDHNLTTEVLSDSTPAIRLGTNRLMTYDTFKITNENVNTLNMDFVEKRMTYKTRTGHDVMVVLEQIRLPLVERIGNWTLSTSTTSVDLLTGRVKQNNTFVPFPTDIAVLSHLFEHEFQGPDGGTLRLKFEHDIEDDGWGDWHMQYKILPQGGIAFVCLHTSIGEEPWTFVTPGFGGMPPFTCTQLASGNSISFNPSVSGWLSRTIFPHQNPDEVREYKQYEQGVEGWILPRQDSSSDTPSSILFAVTYEGELKHASFPQPPPPSSSTTTTWQFQPLNPHSDTHPDDTERWRFDLSSVPVVKFIVGYMNGDQSKYPRAYFSGPQTITSSGRIFQAANVISGPYPNNYSRSGLPSCVWIQYQSTFSVEEGEEVQSVAIWNKHPSNATSTERPNLNFKRDKKTGILTLEDETQGWLWNFVTNKFTRQNGMVHTTLGSDIWSDGTTAFVQAQPIQTGSNNIKAWYVSSEKDDTIRWLRFLTKESSSGELVLQGIQVFPFGINILSPLSGTTLLNSLTDRATNEMKLCAGAAVFAPMGPMTDWLWMPMTTVQRSSQAVTMRYGEKDIFKYNGRTVLTQDFTSSLIGGGYYHTRGTQVVHNAFDMIVPQAVGLNETTGDVYFRPILQQNPEPTNDIPPYAPEPISSAHIYQFFPPKKEKCHIESPSSHSILQEGWIWVFVGLFLLGVLALHVLDNIDHEKKKMKEDSDRRMYESKRSYLYYY